ncbi:uncharacterized protein LOC116935911 [Daphnia magna]|uniref:uncharacterized protein LOC116935911 n=3 Tax=Daphnia magna TaxID=35525 RepID=UPI001E1BC8A8|nr:uncharacterized protein LOC116935911 [Daphnia magna]
MADPLIYILVTFTAKSGELGIGTLEAIAVPKDFHDQSFDHQLEQLKGFIGTKKVIGINWPKFPSNPGWNLPVQSTTKSRSQVQHEVRSCKVISFSEDRDVVVAVRDAMVPPISVKKAVAKKSTPKSSATQKHGTGHKSTSPPRNLPVEKSATVIRKTMGISEEDMEGLDCHLITGENEDKSDTSADSSLDHDDNQQRFFSSESEDEDLIPPTPPPPPMKRKRGDQSFKSSSDTKSKRNSSHNKENSSVTPKRNEKSSAKNSDPQILTSLDVNIVDTPPSSTTKENPKRVQDEQWTELVDAEFHGRNEYMDQIDELKKKSRFSTSKFGILPLI